MGESNPGETYKFTEEFIIKYTPFAVSTLETIISSLTRYIFISLLKKKKIPRIILFMWNYFKDEIYPILQLAIQSSFVSHREC